jgi:hypothetical protein
MQNQHHEMPQRNEHYTPKWVFDKLGLNFDLDVAAPLGNIGSHVPATNYFTEQDDGLQQDWFGRVWCNPPFSKATLWANKFLDYNNGVAIMPNSNAYWVDRLWDSDAHIIKLPYRTFYERPDGTSKRIMYTTYLIAVGDDNKTALKQSGIGKVR